MKNFDGQQLFVMVQRIIKASRPYQDAQDGSYEASLYYHSCEEVERLQDELDPLEGMSTEYQQLKQDYYKMLDKNCELEIELHRLRGENKNYEEL